MFHFISRAGCISALIVGGAPALAGLTICNPDTVSQTVAIGYKSGDAWVSEGWWTLEPGGCAEPIKGDLRTQYYYYRAEVEGREFADESFQFCTSRTEFTIAGDSDCADRGYDAQMFARIDTGPDATDFTFDLPVVVAAAPVPNTTETPAFAPGTYGQAVRAQGWHKECETNDGPPYCAFHTAGIKVIIFDDGRTPQSVFDIMSSLSPGDPIDVQGDLEDVQIADATLVASTVSTRPADDADRAMKLMQGRWASVSDPGSTFLIDGAERFDYYNGGFVTSFTLNVGLACETLSGDSFSGDGLYLWARDNQTGEIDCATIDQVGPDTLDMLALPAGRFQNFRRID